MNDDKLIKLAEDVLDGKVMIIYPRGMGKTYLYLKLFAAIKVVTKKRKDEQKNENRRKNQKIKKANQKT